MENRKLIIFGQPATLLKIFSVKFFLLGLFPLVLLGLFVITPYQARAYNVQTHIYLTSAIFDFYKQHYAGHYSSSGLSDDLKNYLLEGSQREDDAPRWLNHFYDPVKDRGLTYDPAIDPLINVGTWEKSVDWAQDEKNQNSLSYESTSLIASILNASQQKQLGLFPDESNFAWQQAIRYWINGDKEKALFSLGHILHLIEDASVPDHTRNDPHPFGSPYEKFAQKFTLDTPDKNLSERLSDKNPVTLNSLDDYFDKLARYSNNYFFSQDTIGIQSGYDLPRINPENAERRDDGYYYLAGKDEEGDYDLVRKKSLDNLAIVPKGEWSIDNNSVLMSYWERLSVKAAQYGAGAINLFFQDVEKYKNDPEFSRAPGKSFLAQAAASTKDIFEAMASALSGETPSSSQEVSLAAVPATKQSQASSSSAKNSAKNSSSAKNKKSLVNFAGNGSQEIAGLRKEIAGLKKEITKLKSPDNKNSRLNKNPPEAETENSTTSAETIQATTTNKISDTISDTGNKQKTNKFCDFNSSESAGRRIIFNEIAWMGSAKNAQDEWMELKNVSGEEINVSGWQILNHNGNIKINLGDIKSPKIKSGQLILLERTDDNSAPNTPADLIYNGALANSNDHLKLFDAQCRLVDEAAANPDWPAGSNSAKQTMERGTDNFSWHNSAGTGGTPKQNNSSLIINSGGGGGISNNNSAINNSANSHQIAAPQFYPVIITEIMYNPEGADDGREWIEIYNNGTATADLSDWKLSEGGVNHGLTLTKGASALSAGQYAIISADAEKFAKDFPEFSGSLWKSSFSLGNNEDAIVLKNGDLKIDEASYQNAQGANGNGKSLQLTDYSNASSSWQESLPTPGQPFAANEQIAPAQDNASSLIPLRAAFSYAPLNPSTGQTIIFDAGSSTAPTTSTVSYQWDFGDNSATTTSSSTAFHTYEESGAYEIKLAISDASGAQNSSSTTSTIIAVAENYISPASPAVATSSHIVISEIQAGAPGNAEQEFVELYNPEDGRVDLSNWSLKRKTSVSATTTKILVSHFPQGAEITSHGFFLIAHKNYASDSVSDKTADLIYTNNSNPLAYDDEAVILENGGGAIVDEVDYEEILAGQSLERKALATSTADSMIGEQDKFSGNDYDSDSADDFIPRETPEPQSSHSLPEPRVAPSAVSGFTAIYDAASSKIIFNWQPSQDAMGNSADIVYKISELNSSLAPLSATGATSVSAPLSASQASRYYQFSITACDKENLCSGDSKESIYIPSTLPAVFSQPVDKEIFTTSRAISFNQFLGSVSGTVSYLEVMVSGPATKWTAGICYIPVYMWDRQRCAMNPIVSALSNEAVSASAPKTMLTFNFPPTTLDPSTLDSQTAFGIFVMPPDDSTASIYGGGDGGGMAAYRHDPLYYMWGVLEFHGNIFYALR